LHACMHELF